MSSARRSRDDRATAAARCSLRTRLLLITMALLTAGLTASGVLVTGLLRGHLVHRVDGSFGVTARDGTAWRVRATARAVGGSVVVAAALDDVNATVGRLRAYCLLIGAGTETARWPGWSTTCCCSPGWTGPRVTCHCTRPRWTCGPWPPTRCTTCARSTTPGRPG